MLRSARWFLVFFAAYTAAAVGLLVLGLAGAVAEAVPPLRLQVDTLAEQGGSLVSLVSAMASAALSAEPAPQIVLDYAVSVLNLGFGLFLVVRLPGQRVAQLLGWA
jgi:hypothetical protein